MPTFWRDWNELVAERVLFAALGSDSVHGRLKPNFHPKFSQVGNFGLDSRKSW